MNFEDGSAVRLTIARYYTNRQIDSIYKEMMKLILRNQKHDLQAEVYEKIV
jgi:hypothetical protein